MNVNSFGIELLEFCKTYILHIANDRLFGDKGKGCFTYISNIGYRVIDYMLYSDGTLDTLSNFRE